MYIEYAPKYMIFAIWNMDIEISLWSGKFWSQTQVFPSLKFCRRANFQLTFGNSSFKDPQPLK